MSRPRSGWPEVPRPGPTLMPGVLMVDLESSGLHRGSYPVEVGWADDSLAGSSFLVRPDPSWTTDLWSRDAEALHGISREMLMDLGVPVREAVDRVEALRDGGVRLASDSPELDGAWLWRLYEAAGRSMGYALVYEIEVAVLALASEVGAMLATERYHDACELAERAFAKPHRALPDARCNAAILRMALDPAWADVVRGALAAHRRDLLADRGAPSPDGAEAVR